VSRADAANVALGGDDSLLPAVFSGSSAKSIASVLVEIRCYVAAVGDTPYRSRSSANVGASSCN
jgi:hypothetical protein